MQATCAPHIKAGITPEILHERIPAAHAILNRYAFDAIAFTGVSGALFAPVLAYFLNKPLIVVRKQEDKDNHSGHQVEFSPQYREKIRTYVIVDDLVSSGITARKIVNGIANVLPEAECIGILEIRNTLDKSFGSRVDFISDAPLTAVPHSSYNGVPPGMTPSEAKAKGVSTISASFCDNTITDTPF